MSKELTPLKALNDLIDYLESEHLDLSKEDNVVERKQIIEDALEDYEETKFLYEDLMEQYELVMDLIEQYELKIKNKSKKLKALEIIKQKEVDAGLIMETPNVAHYNRYFEHSKIISLTKKTYSKRI